MAEQLNLYRNSGLPVRPLAVKREANRLVRQWASAGCASIGWAHRQYLVELATLQELRVQYRAAVRECKRTARQQGARLRGKAAVLFAATPEGRRAHRRIDEMSERIQSEKHALCG